MARMSEIRDGLSIMLEYGDCAVDAEHDVFYASEIRPEDIDGRSKLVLHDLGWRWDDSQDCWYHYC